MSKSSLRAKAIAGLSFGGKGNSGLAETTGDNRNGKRARSARKKATGCMMRSAAGCKMAILVYSKCREFQTGSPVISYLKPR